VATAVQVAEGGPLWKYYHQVVGSIVIPESGLKAD
jgi:hypothetical protein